MIGPCLFDINEDPCETTNVAHLLPGVLRSMEFEVKRLKAKALLPRNKPSDPRANPAQFNGTWSSWYTELGISGIAHRNNAVDPILPLAICILIFVMESA